MSGVAAADHSNVIKDGCIIMTNYRITVNGNTYNVGVEEIGGAPGAMTVSQIATAPAAAPAAAPTAAPAAESAAEPAPNPKTVKQAASKAAAASGPTEDVLAPLPGTVISVSVSEGDRVNVNQVLLIFEAMKMENEIVASRAGTVIKVHVAKGDVLESGRVVITLA